MPEILCYESPPIRDAKDIRDLIAMHRLVGWMLIGLAIALCVLLAGYAVFLGWTRHRFNLHDVLYPPPDSDPALLIDIVCLVIGGIANLISAKSIQQRRHRALSLGVAAANLFFCFLIIPGLLTVRTFRTLCRREVKAQYQET
jgi:hypothetical protein